MLQRPRRLVLVTDSTHGTVKDHPVVGFASSVAAERDEESDGATEGFRVEKGRKRRRVFLTEGIEKRDAVVNDWINVRDMKLETFGEAVTLVVDSADGESGLGEVDGG